MLAWVSLAVSTATAMVAPSAAAPGVLSSSSTREALLRSAWLDFRRNTAAHDRECAQSADLGYRPINSMPDPAVLPKTVAFDVPLSGTGMGPACPFASSADSSSALAPLVFTTEGPIVSAEECSAIIEETREHIAAGKGGSGFTLADTNRNIAVADLPKTLAWLNSAGLPRVAALAGQCLGAEAIGDPQELLIYRALVVQYECASSHDSYQCAHPRLSPPANDCTFDPPASGLQRVLRIKRCIAMARS